MVAEVMVKMEHYSQIKRETDQHGKIHKCGVCKNSVCDEIYFYHG